MSSSIAFAPKDWLASVHGEGSRIGNRISALTNFIFPVHVGRADIVSSYVHYDAVVTDHNPFLAAYSLSRLVAQGKSCLLVLGDDGDDWPYDLLLSKPMGTFLAALANKEADYDQDAVPVPSRLIGDMLYPIAKSVTVCKLYSGVHLSARHPSGAVALFGNPRSGTGLDSDDLRSDLNGAVSLALHRSPRLSKPLWGRLAIFAEEVVLTGRPTSFANARQDGDKLFWDHPRITAMGSASHANRTPPEAAYKMIEELAALHELVKSLGSD